MSSASPCSASAKTSLKPSLTRRLRVYGFGYLPTYDGNGNVVSLLNASNGVVAAAYEYSPFGELLQQTGSYAAANPFRSATKFTDAETGLIYYGHRYYSPSLGRFINRDPIGENGGLNVYGFVGNDGVNSADYLGLIDFDGDGVDDGSPDDIVIERGDGRTRRRVPPGVDLEALIREATNRQSRRLYTLLLESSTDEGSPLVSSGPYYSGSGIDADRAANKAKVAGELAASHVLPEPKGEIAPSSGGAPSLRQMLAFVATSDAFDPRTRVAAFLAFIPVNLRARLYAAAYEASGGDAMYADAQADIMLGLTAEVGIAGAHAVRRLFSAAESNLTTVYRGVDADHPGLADALQGRAVPRGMGGGHTNPDFHNAGNTVSEFTSWSIRRNVADEFATASGPGGVTLQLRVPRSTLIRTVDGSGESEFLLRGPVQGAKVLQPLRENLPVWFSRQ